MPKDYDILTYGKNVTIKNNWQTNPPDYYATCTMVGTEHQSVSSLVARKTRSFQGSKTPNWKEFKRANGFIPTTACVDDISTSRAIVTEYENFGFCGATYVKNNVEFRRRAPSPVGAPYDRRIQDIVASKLRQKVMQQDFNSAVAIAEAKQVDLLFRDTARRIALSIRALRKGDLSKTLSLLKVKNAKNGHLKDLAKDLKLTKKDVHSYWLELQYGWKPLLSDLDGAAKSLARANSERNSSSLTRVESRDIIGRSVSPVMKNDGLTGTVIHEGRAWVIVRVRNDGLKAANEMGLLNPLSVAWELVPFSFVADWFVNVGDYIQECTAFSGLDVVDSGTSYCMTAKGITRNNGNYQPDVGETLVVHYERSPGFPIMPTLMVKPNPFSREHMLNAVALIRQVTRK